MDPNNPSGKSPVQPSTRHSPGSTSVSPSGSEQQSGSVKEVPVDSRYTPEWKQSKGASIRSRDVSPWNPPAYSLTKPNITSNPTSPIRNSAEVRERVLARLQNEDFELTRGDITGIRASHKKVMSERVQRIRVALGKQPARNTEPNDWLIDLGESADSIEVTKNLAMALALQLVLAQDQSRTGINNQRTSKQAWSAGLRNYGNLQEAWQDLFEITRELCTDHSDLMGVELSGNPSLEPSVTPGSGFRDDFVPSHSEPPELEHQNRDLPEDLTSFPTATPLIPEVRSQQPVIQTGGSSKSHEVETLRQQLQTATAESNAVRQENQSLQAESLQLGTTIEEEKARLEEMGRELTLTRSEVTRLKSELEQKDRELERLFSIEQTLLEKSDLEGELEGIRLRFSEVEQERNELREKEKALQEKLRDESLKILGLEQQLVEQQQNNETLLREKNELSSRLESVSQKLSGTEEKLLETSIRLEESAAEVTALKSLKSELEASVESLRGDSLNKDSVLTSLKQQLLQIQQELEKKESKVSELTRKSEELSVELATLNEEQSLAESQHTEEVQELTTQIEQLKSEKEISDREHQEELQRASSEYEKLKKQESLKETAHQRALEDLQQKITEAHADKSTSELESQAKISDLKSQLREVTEAGVREREASDVEIERLKEQLTQAQEKTSASESENQQQITSLEEQLTKLSEDKSSEQAVSASAIERLTQELKQAREANTASQSESQETIQKLTVQLARLAEETSTEHDTSVAAIERLNAQLLEVEKQKSASESESRQQFSDMEARLNQQVEEKSKELASSTTEVERLNEQLARLRENQSTSESENQKKFSELETQLTQQVQQSSKELETSAAEVERLKAQLTQVEEQKSASESENQKIFSELEARLTQQFEEKSKELEASTTEVQQLKAQLLEVGEQKSASESESQQKFRELETQLTQQFDEKSKELEASTTEVQQLKAQLLEVEKQKIASESENQKIFSELEARLTQQFEEKSKELEASTTEVQQLKAQLLQVEEQKSASESESRKKITELEEQLIRLSEKNETEQGESVSEIQRLKQVLEDARSESTVSQAESQRKFSEMETQLTQQVQASTTEIQQLKAELVQIQRDKSTSEMETQKRISDQTAQTSQLTEQKARENEVLSAEKRSLTEELAQAKEEKVIGDSVNQTRVSDLETQLNEKEEAAEAERVSHEKEIQSIHQQLDEKSSSELEKAKRLQELETELTNRNEKIQAAQELHETELKALTRQLGDSKEENKRLVSDSASRVEALEGQLRSQGEEKLAEENALKLQLEHLQQQLNEKADSDSAKDKQIVDLESRLSELTEKTTAENESHALLTRRLQKQLGEQQQANARIESERDSAVSQLGSELSTEKQKSEKLQLRITELEQQLERLTSDKESAVSSLNSQVAGLTQRVSEQEGVIERTRENRILTRQGFQRSDSRESTSSADSGVLSASGHERLRSALEGVAAKSSEAGYFQLLGQVQEDDLSPAHWVAFQKFHFSTATARQEMLSGKKTLSDKKQAGKFSPGLPAPSDRDFREQSLKLNDAYREKVSALREGFLKGAELNSDDVESDILEIIDFFLGSVADESKRIQAKETVFSEALEEFDPQLKSLDSEIKKALKEKTPAETTDFALITINGLLREERQEVREFLVGSCVRNTIKQLEDKLKESLESVSTTDKDERRIKIQSYCHAIQRFAPEWLPAPVRSTLNPVIIRYLQGAVDHTLKQVDGQYPRQTPQSVLGLKTVDPRSEPGHLVARRMIESPDIRPGVLTLLSSLQSSHEGVKKGGYDYLEDSRVGLKVLCDDHGLVSRPIMKELLAVAIQDLEDDDSLLATEYARQHRGQEKAKKGISRRKKLLDHCTELKKSEKSTDASVLYRGQHVSESKLTLHPHKEVLDCFSKEGTVLSDVNISDAVLRGNYKERDVIAVSSSALSSFLGGACCKAVVRTSDQSGFECIQLNSDTVIPSGLMFIKAGPNRWEVSLGHTTWVVDPGILLDNPDMRVPFEGGTGGQIQRDWLPLKNRSGETAILALRNTPEHPRFFLYEMGEGNALIPRVISSEDPARERLEAEFFYQSALPDKDIAKPVSGSREDIDPSVSELHGAGISWLQGKSTAHLNHLYQETQAKKFNDPVPPLVMEAAKTLLDNKVVGLGYLRQVQAAKVAKSKIGVKLDTYTKDREAHCYARFSVGASFEKVGREFFEQCQKQLRESSPVLKQMRAEQDDYRDEVFKDLKSYSGCELKPQLAPRHSPEAPLAGTPAHVGRNLQKVIKINSDHRMRLSQSISRLEKQLVTDLRRQNTEALEGYTNRELLDRAIIEFERGRLPAGEDQEKNAFVELLVTYLLEKNDLSQSARLKNRLDGLMKKLTELENDSVLLFNNPGEYERRVQQWNLEMALLASDQEMISLRLESYRREPLKSSARACISFECREKTVLRENQVQEVQSALKEITDSLTHDRSMTRISHKGTGWGKSTIVQLLSDHAVAENQDNPGRSVLVVAPVSNQAELDITLSRYFDQKGCQYRRLDLHKDHVAPGRVWWTEEKLDQIHNVLLGIPAETYPSDRAKVCQMVRAPVGASIRDVQILSQLHSRLDSMEEPDSEQRLALKKLNGIFDLIRESMVFMDEWDSALVPSRKEDLQALASEVNESLSGLKDPAKVTSEDIIRGQARMVLGCKRKHQLSATTGTTYAAAIVSGATTPESIREKCNSDPLTTQPRFWHWLNEANPVYIDMSKTGARKDLFGQIVDQVGSDREILIFDGNKNEGKAEDAAVADYKLLTEVREEHGGQSKGMLFYDKDKCLHMYQQGHPVYGKGNGQKVPRDEEAVMRAEGGRDVFHQTSESIGTSSPQRNSSVGVYMGLLEQSEAGRVDDNAQRLGRLRRASPRPRNPQALYMVVDTGAAEKLTGNSHLAEFKHQQEHLQTCRTQLQSQLDSPMKELSEEKKQAIYAPLVVNPPKVENPGELDRRIEEAVDQEITRLRLNEWPKKGFDTNQTDRLADFKKAEWLAKKEYLLMTSEELARREISEHTKECEALLQEAQVESYLEQELAIEEDWMKTGVSAAMGNFTFSSDALGRLPVNYQSSQFAAELLKAGIISHMKTVPRRQSSHSGTIQGIEEDLNSEQIKAEIKRGVSELREGSVPVLGLNYIKDSQIRLEAESRKQSRQAIANVNEVIRIIEGESGRRRMFNVGALKRCVEKFERQMMDTQNTGQHLLAGKNIETFYNEFLEGLTNVGFSIGMHRNIVDLTGKINAVLSRFADVDGTSLGSSQILFKDKEAFEEYFKEPNAARALKRTPSKEKAKQGPLSSKQIKRISVDRLRFRGASARVFVRPSLSLNENVRIEKLKKQATRVNELSDKQDDYIQATKLVETKDEANVKVCLDELENFLLTRYEVFDKEREQRISDKVKSMDAQEALMQKNIEQTA